MEDLINKYFEKSLTEKELEDFQQKLETDAEFKAEFEFHKSVQEAIHAKERTEIKIWSQALKNRRNKAIGGNTPPPLQL
ncbi:MAG: hypothetical protein IPO04_12165 [Cytophagaceae bacterium]|nr:hypothetical protein [Cytophagaceae bacterium]